MSHVRISPENKRCFNVKSSTYYFYMKTKILAEFQICISVPLNENNVMVERYVLFGWIIVRKTRTLTDFGLVWKALTILRMVGELVESDDFFLLSSDSRIDDNKCLNSLEIVTELIVCAEELIHNCYLIKKKYLLAKKHRLTIEHQYFFYDEVAEKLLFDWLLLSNNPCDLEKRFCALNSL